MRTPEREGGHTLLGGAAAAWPLSARAQQTSIVQKVGFLYPGPSTAANVRIDAFLGGLRTAGYRVPEQVEIISRFADGDPTRLAPMAVELVDRNVDVIAAVSTGAANAVRVATTTIPIVALDLETDPVSTDMISSLAHREGSGEHRPVDINTIVDESLNLAYTVPVPKRPASILLCNAILIRPQAWRTSIRRRSREDCLI